MQNSRGVALSCALIIGVCSTLLPASAEISEQHYLVLSRVLEHGLGEECRELVIEERTTSGSFALNTPGSPLEETAELVGVKPGLLAKWQRTNLDFEFLTDNLSLDCTYHLISTEQREALFDSAAVNEPEQGWRNFRRKYADAAGIIRMSIPVFDETGQHALTYVEFDCGPSCGSGRFVVLDKSVQAGWAVTGGSLVWMAAE